MRSVRQNVMNLKTWNYPPAIEHSTERFTFFCIVFIGKDMEFPCLVIRYITFSSNVRNLWIYSELPTIDALPHTLYLTIVHLSKLSLGDQLIGHWKENMWLSRLQNCFLCQSERVPSWSFGVIGSIGSSWVLNTSTRNRSPHNHYIKDQK